MKPKRIQLSRRKGWKKPAGTVVVSRPSKWGNPFVIGTHAKVPAGPVRNGEFSYLIYWGKDDPGPGYEFVSDKAKAVELYQRYCDRSETHRREVKRELAGKDLCCWCPPGSPCHADILLAIANN